MRVSVFTPSHNPRFLDDCYRSLVAQSLADWEWVVLLNGRATWEPPQPDPRVHVARAPSRLRAIGGLKRTACELATGDILVELDHDDLLAPTALEAIRGAMARPEQPALVYSDFAQINADGSPNHDRFDQTAGWQYSPTRVGDVTYLRCHALSPTPHNVSYIWYAPNHVRAFRRRAYEAVGGYDATLEILDDQDLLMRLFAAGSFHHLPECLYLQRIHERNTQSRPATNALIQERTVEMYQRLIEPVALAWATREGLATISLTTPTSQPIPDLDPRLRVLEIDPSDPSLPFDADQVGVIKAVDVLQRAPDRSALLNECYRTLTHAGLLLTDTPSTDGRGAFQDPSHVAFYNENSFSYLTQRALRGAIPTLAARLQISHLVSYWPSETHKTMNIPYVKANLMAIKEGSRQGGPLLV